MKHGATTGGRKAWRMLFLAACICLAAPGWGAPGAGSAWAAAQPELAGTVSLRVTAQSYDVVMPWLKNPEQTLQGTALVVQGQHLLTTADMVKNATLIEVRKFGRYPDYPARAVQVDYAANLALLAVDAPEFWQGLGPLPLGAPDATPEAFTISRWRGSGRFEQGAGGVVDYTVAPSRFGTLELPVLRGTTTMGGLGWSEVMTVAGHVIGLVTSHDGQEVQAVPAGILHLFLEAAQQQLYPGFAQRGFSWQRINNPSLRAQLGLPADGQGVLILSTAPSGMGARTLRAGDILTKLGPYTVDPEGLIDHPLFGRVLFPAALNESLQPTIPVDVVRGGKLEHQELRRSRVSSEDYRVHPYVFDLPADYEVQGGLVLQELSATYLKAWGNPWSERAPPRLVTEAILHGVRDKDQPPEKLVFVSKVLPDPANLGYDDVQDAIVTRVNGKPVRSLTDLREALLHPVDGYQVLEMRPWQSRARVVFQADQLQAANARIRQRYGLPERPVPAKSLAASGHAEAAHTSSNAGGWAVAR